jgi:hypothetical protein
MDNKIFKGPWGILDSAMGITDVESACQMIIIPFAIHCVAMHFKQIGVIVFAQGYTVPVSGSKSFLKFLQHTSRYFQPLLAGWYIHDPSPRVFLDLQVICSYMSLSNGTSACMWSMAFPVFYIHVCTVFGQMFFTVVKKTS